MHYFDQKDKSFHDFKLGQLLMVELVLKFTHILRYMPYITEEKAKVQCFINFIPLSFKERIEYGDPKPMDETIIKVTICYQ